ncbi:unnamed protein product [Rotaria sp. Silwood2]|nr:unnamed protein product [Rotaria sp. Silwood2]CAF2663678.1 unnamed protein product [Rotaria sp. Silwood2]CAF2870354.1 unnamed protein product [Rotaria sp. Silwood2]CAF3010622.1 unnamed protein product [Rotaria sp. Silwood2]CAF3924974.1 unnamed protein product [Rotaria sp. Silwood2]
MIPTEARTLRDLVHNSKCIGGNYGSLAKSKIFPTFYIVHKVESDDTLQRLALKYSINIQEIKRVNKLWSDAELGLLEHVYIPINSPQISVLRTQYPTLDIVQNLPLLTNPHRKSSINTNTTDETTSSNRSSDSLISISTTNNSSYQDYLSKIDQQIQLTRKSLQLMDIKGQHLNSESHEIFPSHVSNKNNTNSCKNNRTTTRNNEQPTSAHHRSDNSVFLNNTTYNSREKYISAALERIQREKDDFDEL